MNQSALQHKRLELRVGYAIFEVPDMLNKLLDLRRMRLVVIEIRLHSFFQIFGFADIDHMSKRVLHQIHAWR
ncbi:hypothetical protein D3C72_2360980 [compost metagenome]